MKSHTTNSGNRSMRWKWMAGATAATAAGATTSQASLITVNLTNNYIFPGGDHLNADLTGDGHPDFTIANAYVYSTGYPFGRAGVSLNGVGAAVYFHESGGIFRYRMHLGLRDAYYAAFQGVLTVPPRITVRRN